MEIVRGVCYTGSTGKSEENISTQDIRQRLREEILSLSNEQAEYVLRRMLETNE